MGPLFATISSQALADVLARQPQLTSVTIVGGLQSSTDPRNQVNADALAALCGPSGLQDLQDLRVQAVTIIVKDPLRSQHFKSLVLLGRLRLSHDRNEGVWPWLCATKFPQLRKLHLGVLDFGYSPDEACLVGQSLCALRCLTDLHIANTFDEGNGRAYSCVLQQLTALTLLRRLAIGHKSLAQYPTPEVTALLAASSDLRFFSTVDKSGDAVDLQPLLAAMPHALSIQVQSRTLAPSGSALQLPSALTALDLSVSGAPRSCQLDALSRVLCHAGTRLQAVSLAGFQPVASIAGVLWERFAHLTSLRDLCLSLPFARAQEWVAAMAEFLPVLRGLRTLHVFDLSMLRVPRVLASATCGPESAECRVAPDSADTAALVGAAARGAVLLGEAYREFAAPGDGEGRRMGGICAGGRPKMWGTVLAGCRLSEVCGLRECGACLAAQPPWVLSRDTQKLPTQGTYPSMVHSVSHTLIHALRHRHIAAGSERATALTVSVTHDLLRRLVVHPRVPTYGQVACCPRDPSAPLSRIKTHAVSIAPNILWVGQRWGRHWSALSLTASKTHNPVGPICRMPDIILPGICGKTCPAGVGGIVRHQLHAVSCVADNVCATLLHGPGTRAASVLWWPACALFLQLMQAAATWHAPRVPCPL